MVGGGAEPGDEVEGPAEAQLLAVPDHAPAHVVADDDDEVHVVANGRVDPMKLKPRSRRRDQGRRLSG